MANRRSHRRTTQPVCEALESRELLSATTMGVVEHHATAEVESEHKQSHFPSPVLTHLNPLPTVSTVPTNGDVNPYGVAFVPSGFPSGGKLNPGDVLVANFNNSNNVQGTGTTIVRITPKGNVSTFFNSASPGLDTALAVLKSGFVIVGNVPTPDGSFANITQGSLQIIDKNGKVVTTLMDSKFLTEPWDMTVNDQGNHVQLFVSTFTTGQSPTGMVTRIDLTISPSGTITVGKPVVIASGYTVTPNQAAVVLAPTGLAFDPKSGTLYVASTGDNAIYAISKAATSSSDGGKGKLIFNDATFLNGPLGLVLAPNGALITANGDAFNPMSNVPPSDLIEFTPQGKFLAQFQVDPAAGGAFGLAISPFPTFRELAAVDDNTNVDTGTPALEEFGIF
jgi:sugar lactone lactonase YvrE